MGQITPLLWASFSMFFFWTNITYLATWHKMVKKTPKRLNDNVNAKQCYFYYDDYCIDDCEKLEGKDTLKTLRSRSRLILSYSRVQNHFRVQWKSLSHQRHFGYSTRAGDVKACGAHRWYPCVIHVLNYRLHENHPNCQNSLTVEWALLESTMFKQGLLRQTSIKDGWDICL